MKRLLTRIAAPLIGLSMNIASTVWCRAPPCEQAAGRRLELIRQFEQLCREMVNRKSVLSSSGRLVADGSKGIVKSRSEPLRQCRNSAPHPPCRLHPADPHPDDPAQRLAANWLRPVGRMRHCGINPFAPAQAVKGSPDALSSAASAEA